MPSRSSMYSSELSSTKTSPLSRLFRVYVGANLPQYVLGSLCLWATNYLSVAIPVEIGASIDALATTQSTQHIVNIAWMGLVVILVRTFSRVLFFNPGREVEYKLRKDLYGHLLSLSPSFYAKHNRGDIISRASNDITWVRALIGFGTLQVINLFFIVLLTIWQMFSLSPLVSMMILAPIVVGGAVVQYSIRSWYPLIKKNQVETGKISEHILESVQGVATIQGFQAQHAFVAELQKRQQDWYATGMYLKVMQSSILPVVALSGGLSVFFLLYFGVPLVEQKQLTVGDIVVFITLLAGLVPYMRSVGWMLSTWQTGSAAAERIFELFETLPERPEGENGIQLEEKVPTVFVRNLSFAYPDQPDKMVLQDISFSIEPGQTIGIFGKTGSGKSTLLKVLSRMYTPDANMIFVNDHDIRTVDIFSWRKKLSMVPQRPFLFGDSIASNISFVDTKDVDTLSVEQQKRLDWAVELASLHQDIPSLPNGLKTVVGERGIMLSGGQRQRVALARGLYHGGDIIMLDDVLSAVDHENEQRLVDSISTLSSVENAQQTGKPSCCIVSNRISAFRRADIILVLENGSIVDRGTHQELLSRPGLYRQAYEAQREDQGTTQNASESLQNEHDHV